MPHRRTMELNGRTARRLMVCLFAGKVYLALTFDLKKPLRQFLFIWQIYAPRFNEIHRVT